MLGVRSTQNKTSRINNSSMRSLSWSYSLDTAGKSHPDSSPCWTGRMSITGDNKMAKKMRSKLGDD